MFYPVNSCTSLACLQNYRKEFFSLLRLLSTSPSQNLKIISNSYINLKNKECNFSRFKYTSSCKNPEPGIINDTMHLWHDIMLSRFIAFDWRWLRFSYELVRTKKSIQNVKCRLRFLRAKHFMSWMIAFFYKMMLLFF